MRWVMKLQVENECKCGYRTGHHEEWWSELKFAAHVLWKHWLLRRG